MRPLALVSSLVLCALLSGAPAVAVLAHDMAAPDGTAPLGTRAALRAAVAKAGVRRLTRPEADEPELVALGRSLFFDKLLSGDCEVSCASCHSPRRATGDGLPVSLDARGAGKDRGRPVTAERLLARNTQPLFNVGLSEVPSAFWDARVARGKDGALHTPSAALNDGAHAKVELAQLLDGPLAAQAMFPVVSASEMRGEKGANDLASAADETGVWAGIMKRVLRIREYRDLFAAAYPLTKASDLTFAHAARAIAAFERAAWTRIDTPFDRWLAGDERALDERAARGAGLFFGRARCASCHSGPLLSDFERHSLAVPRLGRERAPYRKEAGFRTPPLRNVALTGPWMHDGCFATLDAVVRHHLDPRGSLERYTGAELAEPFRATLDRDPEHRREALAALDPLLAKVGLSDDEIRDLVAFLEALTDPEARRPVESPRRVPSGLRVD